MSKLDQIVDFLETEKTDVAVVSDPVTINYLTGFYSDPHERQLFLFVYTDHEPLLFVPALEVERATAVVDFQVVGYVDSENLLMRSKKCWWLVNMQIRLSIWDSTPSHWIKQKLIS